LKRKSVITVQPSLAGFLDEARLWASVGGGTGQPVRPVRVKPGQLLNNNRCE
jgi:hypothetical protein